MRAGSVLVLTACCAVLISGCSAPLTPEGRRCLQAGHDAYVRGDDQQAIRATTRFLHMHARIEEAGEAYYIRGLARCRANRDQLGKADLAAALNVTRRKDVMALAHARLGSLAYDGGDMAEAEARYRAALKVASPDAPPADQAMYRLGCVLQRLGRWEEADSQFDRLMHTFRATKLARLAKDRVRAERWSIQAGALTRRSAARELQRTLRGAGLAPREDLELRDGRIMRLIRVGSYATYAEALAKLPSVRRVCGDAHVTAAR